MEIEEATQKNFPSEPRSPYGLAAFLLAQNTHARYRKPVRNHFEYFSIRPFGVVETRGIDEDDVVVAELWE